MDHPGIRFEWKSLELQGNYAVSGGVKGVEAVEAKAKSFKARMTVSLIISRAIVTSSCAYPFHVAL
jgi:hypothetical protein